MHTNWYLVVLCFAVVLPARLTMAVNGFEFGLLIKKVDYLQGKLQAVERSVENSYKKIEHLLKESNTQQQERLVNLEASVMKTIDKVDSKFDIRMNTVEDSLRQSMQKTEQSLQKSLANLEDGMKEKTDNVATQIEIRMNALEVSTQKIMKEVAQSVKTSEEKTARGLHELENKLTSKLNSFEQNLITLNISYQETLQTELKKVEENDKKLDILKFSVQNVTTVVENSKTILTAHFTYPVRSCRDVTKLSGRYVLHRGENAKPLKVFCEQAVFGGGWTVIQYRFEGFVYFYRKWSEYRDGFGNVDGEFWLGLEHVHRMTKDRPHELIVEVKDFQGNYGYAKYDAFEIGDESEMYQLKKLGRYSGTAGDAMLYNRGNNFSTFDRDNDQSKGHCAVVHRGAWWYYNCGSANLNGSHLNRTNDETAMAWFRQKKSNPVSYSRMMIREIID